MNHFCTISTKSHQHKTLALADSLQRHGECVLHVLLVDGAVNSEHRGCRFFSLTDLANEQQAQQVVLKYSSSSDKLRWCLKPVFMNYLLHSKELNVERLIYLDNDLFFFSDYGFLFELLRDNNFILTPHYYNNSPGEKQNWFEANYRVGLYNAGFIGANRNSKSGLHWWAECCLYRCEKSAVRGLFDDQKYLDLLPIVEDKVHVLKHKGCNLAGWNKEVCKRSLINGQVIIDNIFPIVFIHFNSMTIREILTGDDSILLPYFREYLVSLKKFKPKLAERDLLQPIPLSDKLKYAIWKFFTQMGI